MARSHRYESDTLDRPASKRLSRSDMLLREIAQSYADCAIDPDMDGGQEPDGPDCE